MALALVGTLIASMGVVLMGATSATAAKPPEVDTGQEPCPDDPGEGGWNKVDQAAGSASGAWGSISWGGVNGTAPEELEYSVVSGYVLDVCIKSGQNAGGEAGDEKRVFHYGLTGADSVEIGQAISHIAYRASEGVPIPGIQAAAPPTCDAAGSYTLPQDTDLIDWSITPAYAGAGTYEVKATTKDSRLFTDGDDEKSWTVIVLPATGDCASRPIPPRPTPSAPTCAVDGSLTLPASTDGLTWSIVPVAPTADSVSPYGPGTYAVTVESSGLPFPDGKREYTYPNITVAGNTGPCGDTTTTRNVSDERISCALGVERRAGTVTTINGQAQPAQWGPWQVVRGLSDAEFEERGCRPDQPEPAEVLGSETRVNCVGVQQRSSSQVTTFVWNASTREYETVVRDAVWSDWKTVRKLTSAELKAEGCVLGEETMVPSPKPDEKPTVRGVERVAPPAAVPTAVAAGAGAASPSALTQLLAQLLVGGGMLLLLAGGWIRFGRREGGAHEA